jgi:hypothetical protein
LEDIGRNEIARIFPSLELMVNQQRRSLKDVLAIDTEDCAIRPGNVLLMGLDAADHDLEAACTADLLEGLHVDLLFEGEGVPPIQVKKTQSFCDLMIRIFGLQVAAKADLVVATAIEVEMAIALAACENLIAAEKATTHTVLQPLIFFL